MWSKQEPPCFPWEGERALRAATGAVEEKIAHIYGLDWSAVHRFAQIVRILALPALVAGGMLLTGCQGSSQTAKMLSSSTDQVEGRRPVQLLAGENASTSANIGSGAVEVVRREVDEKRLAKAVERYRLNKKQKQSPYRSVGLDLNADGKTEVLVLLEGGDWCTSTGCTLAIFTTGKFGYRPMATIRRVWDPVILTNEHHNGWSDLVVETGKRSLGQRVRLRFGSRGYPGNAVTLTPMPSDIEVNGEVVIERAEIPPQLVASGSNP